MRKKLVRPGRKATKSQSNPRKWLIELREEKGWTQKDVADKVGISHQHYANIERTLRIGSGYVLLRLADLFDVPIKRFFDMEPGRSDKSATGGE